MNKIVAAWRRHNKRKKYTGPDALNIEGERIVLPLNEEKRDMPSPQDISISRPSVVKSAVVKLALYGRQDRVERLFRETTRTLTRLRLLAAAGKARPFEQPPAGQGGEPNLHDVSWWLDSLKRGKRDAQEVKFLYRLHATAARRARPESLQATGWNY